MRHMEKGRRVQSNKRSPVSIVLVALMAASVLVSGCASLNLISGRSQARTVAMIERLGGYVRYDYEKVYPDIPNVFDHDVQPTAPTWLRKLFGDEYFGDVVLVGLADTPTTDEDLRHLRNFPHLENLNLANTNITGSGLVHLRGLTDLQYLSLWNTPVDDDELENITGLTKMYALILDGTDITDAGLVHLEGMTNLKEWLGLSHTQITDGGVCHLKGFTKLRSINLRVTNVTYAGVAELEEALPNTDISWGP